MIPPSSFPARSRVGPRRVYAIDAPARSYEPDMTQGEYDERVAALMSGADQDLVARQMALEDHYERLARQDDSLKTVIPLRDYLLHENVPSRVLTSHGQYLIGSFYFGRDDDNLGPDMRTRSYNRNLRIVHNIQRLTGPRDERVLVIIGSGHLPILAHAFRASPEYRLREVSDYLGRWSQSRRIDPRGGPGHSTRSASDGATRTTRSVGSTSPRSAPTCPKRGEGSTRERG